MSEPWAREGTSKRLLVFGDHRLHAVIDDPGVRLVEVEATQTAQESVRRLDAGDAGALLIGQLLAAAGILTGHVKGQERISLQVFTNGNLGLLMADAHATGEMRARVQYPRAGVAGKTPEARSRNALGQGHLVVQKSLEGRELYRGVASFSHVDLAGALQTYFEQSEQVSSRVWLAVVQQEGKPIRVRGLLFQALGGGDRLGFESLSQRLPSLRVQQLLQEDVPLPEIFAQLLPDVQARVMEEIPLSFRCACSEERVLGMLAALGSDELSQMLEQDGHAQVTCDFCSTQYRVDSEGLKSLIALCEANTPR